MKHSHRQIADEVASGIYEKHRKLRSGDVVLDIGAHYGHFAILASEKVGPTGLVYAFEPNPDNFAKLSDNTQDFLNIRKVNAAAWDFDAMMDFYISEHSYNHSMYPLCHNQTGVIKVKTIDVGAWAARNNIVPQFVKLDAESSEEKVIRSILLADLRPEFAIEVHTEELYGHCKELFRKAGYFFEPTEPTGRVTLCYAWFEDDDIGAL
jgi:FkbM family methyltransferase